MDRDRLDSTAAHGAFFLLISFLPFVAFLLTLMQRIHFSDGVSLIEAALGALPDSVAAYLESLLPSALESTGVLPVAVITAVWSSSMGMVAVIKGLDQIYGAKEPRGYLRLRAMAVLCVIVFAAALIVAAALVVLGSTLYRFLLEKSPPLFAAILLRFKSLAGFVLLLCFFTLLYAGVPAAERKERAVRALGRVGLESKQKNLPSQLSGGQQQRVSIARALAGNPSVILADEPTGALDSRTGREVLGFLKKLNREGDTVVLITHDNSIAVKADRIIRLQDGKIIYDGDAHDPRAVVQPGEAGEENEEQEVGA